MLVLVHWRFGTEPKSIRIVVETPFGLIEQRIAVQEMGKRGPAELSPFAGLRLMLPMNLRLQPLVPGMVIDAWMVVEPQVDEEEERYPLGRLTVSTPPAPEPASHQPKRRRRKKAQAGV